MVTIRKDTKKLACGNERCLCGQRLPGYSILRKRITSKFYLGMNLKMGSNALIPVFICFIALVTMSSSLASEGSDIRNN